jgi:type II secretory ATPase GspE/PulE/Tfp pilus assembly ATPase PilB-like protein
MLLSKGMLSHFQAGLLSFLVDSQSSILIAGDVGSGKTSLLTALLLELPQKYRILTIEDTPEIPIKSLQKLGWKVQALSTLSPVMDSGEITPEKALRAALRLGNSALVIGEVRGPEVRTLYEAMQIGTAGNSVLGTIHGASAEAVYERIVDTLGVPKSSFRITDAVVICSRVREGGGTKKRRVVSRICEVVKEGSRIFLEMDETLPGSELLKRIADRWRVSIDDIIQNIRIRSLMKERILASGKRDQRLLEAEEVAKANNMFWLLVDSSREEHGKPDYSDVYRKWSEWYKKKEKERREK